MNNLKNYYKDKFRIYGPTLKGVGWTEKKKSKNRYKVLLKLLKFKNDDKIFSLLDVGCGYGELVNYIPKNLKYKYTGIDVVKEMVSYAKNNNKNQNCKFYVKNILNISKKYDFIICNGVFTLKNKFSQKEMKQFVVKCIKIFHKFSKIGFSFNLMSEVVDYKSKILFYPSKNIVIKTLKNKNISVIKIDNKSINYERFYFVKK